MAVNLTINGTTYQYPADMESEGWGAQATSWASAVTSGMLQKAGGSFTLTAEVDFGGSYGLKSKYYKSRAASPASAGEVRLGNTETVSWRNAANSADLALTVNASDELQFNGVALSAATTGSADTVLQTDGAGTGQEWGKIANANVDASAAIAYSKLNLTGAVVDGDLAGSITRTKLATGSANHVLINDGSGDVSSEAALAISRGGTGASTASGGFDALSPLTTQGDLLYGGASGTGTRLAVGAADEMLTTDGSSPSWTKVADANVAAAAAIAWTKISKSGSSIDDLGDVDTSTAAPTTGDRLEYDGSNWVPAQGPYYESDPTNWDGNTKTVTYDVSASITDARKMIWDLKDTSNNYQSVGGEIDHPSATQVRVTVAIELANGTYDLVGR